MPITIVRQPPGAKVPEEGNPFSEARTGAYDPREMASSGKEWKLGSRRGWQRVRMGLGLSASFLPLVMFGCQNHDAALVFEAPSDREVSLRRNVQPIFNANCALSGCHDAATHEQNMILAAGSTYDTTFGIVGVASQEAAGLKRVRAGASGHSYLINKLEGTQTQVGGSGERMPFGAGALSADQIQTIRRWIDEGARDN